MGPFAFRNHWCRAGVILICLFGSAGTAFAQRETATTDCTSGWASFGSIGVSGFTCDECGVSRKADGRQIWSFTGEPTIKRITRGGPAEGKLREGDVIVALDGLLITTRAAGERVANMERGRPVVITIRRNGREFPVEVTLGEQCREEIAVAGARATTSAGGAAPARGPVAAAAATQNSGGSRVSVTRPAATATAAEYQPLAWFGFGISCNNCEMNLGNHEAIEEAEAELRALRFRFGEESTPVRFARAQLLNLRREGSTWRFSEYPSLFSVDPGSPAGEAGLRRGDVLTKIDGVSLITSEGGRRFDAVEPGQTVTWTYRRGNVERTARVKAIERPGTEVASAKAESYNRTLVELERLQAVRAQELDSQAARLRETVERAAGEARGETQRQALAELRAELAETSIARSSESQAQLNKLRESLARLDLSLRLSTPSEKQHLRFAGTVGNTDVEVRGLSSVDVSYDNSTGELLIRTMDATIRVKAPVRGR